MKVTTVFCDLSVKFMLFTVTGCCYVAISTTINGDFLNTWLYIMHKSIKAFVSIAIIYVDNLTCILKGQCVGIVYLSKAI